jgi:hypothetical protein
MSTAEELRARAAGATVVATVQIYDRLEPVTKLDIPDFALAEFAAPDNFKAEDCPLCRAGAPINSF